MSIGTKNLMIKGGGLHHIALQTRDWDASLRLYQEVLGMQFVAEVRTDPKIILVDIGDGSHLELFAPQADTPAIGSPAANDPVIHIALATTDARAAIERVRQAGYEVTMEPKNLQTGGLDFTFAFFKGPNGEILEFFQTH